MPTRFCQHLVDPTLLLKLSGESRFFVALREEAERGDLSNLACRAVKNATKGDASFGLIGAKTLVLDAMDCDQLLVAARVGVAEELGVFVLPRESPGARPLESLDGTRKLTRVRLEKAQATRLGCGDARDAIERSARTTAVGLVADGVGAAERVQHLFGDAGEQLEALSFFSSASWSRNQPAGIPL